MMSFSALVCCRFPCLVGILNSFKLLIGSTIMSLPSSYQKGIVYLLDSFFSFEFLLTLYPCLHVKRLTQYSLFSAAFLVGINAVRLDLSLNLKSVIFIDYRMTFAVVTKMFGHLEDYN